MMDYCLEILCYLPQITLSQAEQIIKKIEEMILYNRFGKRLYYQRLFRFYSVIDTYKALEYFYLFKNTRRDICSDCRACEQADMVRLFFRIGDRARADELARPVLDGTLECHDVPRNVQLLYLQQALDYKDLAKAATLAEALYRKSKLGDPSDLGYLGAVLRYFAFTAPRKAKKILKHFLLSWEPLWDQDKWFSFLIGAWTVCHEFAKISDVIYEKMLPDTIPFWRKDGVYNVKEMGNWFYNQAADVAAKFDSRNGTNYYSAELGRAAFSMECKEGQRFLPAVYLV